MKQYRQFLKEMPTKTIVFAFGRFSPPTTGHGLLVSVVKKIASTNKADYVIYASRTQDKKKNPLSVDKKIHYLNLMFPHTNFKPATDTERTFIEVAKALNSKYKNLINGLFKRSKEWKPELLGFYPITTSKGIVILQFLKMHF